VLFRVVSFPPDPDGQMHRTDTLDFVTVVSGELVLALEDGDEATLGPGDTVIQRGTTHAWRNKTDRPAVASVVIVSGQQAV
jgi:quercetin dioxygenase-like cupin family protein